MECLRRCILELSETDDSEVISSSVIYKSLANIEVTDTNCVELLQEIIPRVYDLVEDGKLKKHIIFIAALVNQPLLRILLEHEASTIQIDFRNPKSLFDYVYYKRKHWLLEVLNSVDRYRNAFVDINTLLLILKIVLVTNQDEINIAELDCYLQNSFEGVDQFFKIYVEYVNFISKVVKFVKNHSDLCDAEIFKLLSQKSLIDCLSELVDIENSSTWCDILHELTEHEEFTRKYFAQPDDDANYLEQEIFQAFTILAETINCIKCSRDISANKVSKDDITAKLEIIREQLIRLKNRTLQIELLENIFALIFLRSCDLHQDENTDSFFCGEYEIRLILSLLKSIFEELKKQYSNRIFVEFKRFIDLNKHIADGYWRLELLNCIKKNWYLGKQNKAKTNNILYYMLAAPEALINMCLKQNNLDKAIQVVKIFGLEESILANEIEYSVAFANLRKSINSQSKKGWLNATPKGILNEHNASCKDIIENLNIHRRYQNYQAIETLDLLLTLPLEHSTVKDLINIVDNEIDDATALPSFFHKLKEINRSDYLVSDIILSCSSMDVVNFDREYSKYAKLSKTYDDFRNSLNIAETGILNFNHPLHKLLMEIQTICTGFDFNISDPYINHPPRTPETPEIVNKDHVQYMQKLMKYLRAFSKVFLLEQNNTDLISKGCDTSLFEILEHRRIDLVSKLIYERHVDGVDFDYIFGKMKLDLTYHIGACSFPRVNLNRNNFNWKDHQMFKPRKDVISYIHKRNWLLAFMINRIHGIKDEKIDSNEIRIKTLGNLIQLKDVQHLKQLFNDNETLTVLQQDFCTFITNEEEGAFDTGDNFNPILLKLPQSDDWKKLYELLLSINETKIDANIQKLRDLILCNLIKSRQEPNYYKYIRFINNPRIRLQIILEEMHYWPAVFCIEIIKFEVSLGDCDTSILQSWCEKIELYTQIKDLFGCETWFEIHELCENNKEESLRKILDTYNIDNLINFLHVHSIDVDMFLRIDANYFQSVFNHCNDKMKIKSLFNKLPEEHYINTCRNLLKSLKRLEDLNFVLDLLKEKLGTDELSFRNLEISLKMMTYFVPDEQQQFLSLMEDPLSILEMLLMNTKLDKLGQILQGIQNDIKDSEEHEQIISVEKIDTLLREYAEKSVDFKVVTIPLTASQSDGKIMQSIDSLCLEQKVFVMPETVPAKEEWISDDVVTDCMCCFQTTFSMFNRRHHCRRCGRVICWNCSLQKMLVESYGDILVRVCKDCFKQSRVAGSDSDSLKSERSRLDDFWILTENQDHNAILREEFSYENAPSVLLCLSILKYHSKSDLYPKFLLNQCENILHILHPIRTYFEVEIDFNMIINMLKSLAVAAKMISNQCMLQWGASLADKMISQAEMLGLLAEKGFLHLLSSKSQNVHIDANALRHVREKLLEMEQWHLALEVSTKSGLDTAAVFAKWGKSFLRAGNLQLARMKFHMCFEKCSQYETLDYSSLHESYSNIRSNKSFHQSRQSLNINTKPAKSPLLLNEIIQILESKTEKISLKVLKNLPTNKVLYDSTSSLQSNPSATSARSEDSVSIINKLQSLNAIANGNYPLPESCSDVENVSGPHLENIFYEECIYYLEKYGSHLSLCQFYIRHNEFRQALEYMLENEVGSDVFIEIYMGCLKDGQIICLQQSMLAIDPVLDIWKNHIRHICIYLEKQCMLHSLYQLQQFIGDFVRAAMTCIKFYSHEVTSFEELHNRVEYLKNAQEHLKQELEQEQWVDVQSVHSQQSQEIFEEKSINNPALVMKLNTKEIIKHIDTIQSQIDVVNFLTSCEQSGISVIDNLADIQLPTNITPQSIDLRTLPTLFGSLYEKMQLAILCIVSGEKVEDGFGIASSIVKNYKLKAVKIYCQAGRLLAKAKRYSAVSSLVKCIRSGGEKDNVVTEMCDEMLALTARTLSDHNATDKEMEDVIKHISNRSIKINSYIETKQLRCAFLLAAKFSRISDIRRISREAELYNKLDVKKLCQKYLQIQEQGTSKTDTC